MAVDYRTQAQKEIDAQVNPQLEALKNSLAQKLVGYNNQKASTTDMYNQNVNTVGQNFKAQEDTQNLNNINSKNNFSNTMLGRGLARSSIVGTGLAEADQINNRRINEIETNKTGKLNELANTYKMNISNIDANIANANAENQNSINALMANRENLIAQLARQLENDAFDRQYKMQQLALQKASSESKSGGVSAYTSKNNQASVDEVLGANYDDIAKIRTLQDMYREFSANGDTKSAKKAYASLLTLQNGDKKKQELSNDKQYRLLKSAGLF